MQLIQWKVALTFACDMLDFFYVYAYGIYKKTLPHSSCTSMYVEWFWFFFIIFESSLMFHNIYVVKFMLTFFIMWFRIDISFLYM